MRLAIASRAVAAMEDALEAAGLSTTTACYVGDVVCWATIRGRQLTVHCALREARCGGVTVLGPGSMEPRYRGRGWRERLAQDCAEWLRRKR